MILPLQPHAYVEKLRPLGSGFHIPIQGHRDGELHQVPCHVHRVRAHELLPVLCCELIHALHARERVRLVEAGLVPAPEMLLPQPPGYSRMRAL